MGSVAGDVYGSEVVGQGLDRLDPRILHLAVADFAEIAQRHVRRVGDHPEFVVRDGAEAG